MPGKIQEHHTKPMSACGYSFYDKSIAVLTFQNKTQEVNTPLTANAICWQNETNLWMYIIDYLQWKKPNSEASSLLSNRIQFMGGCSQMDNNCKYSIRMDTEVTPRHKILSIANTFLKSFVLGT